MLSSTKSPIWSSNCVKSQDSSNQTFNSSNIPTKFSEAITSRSRPSEVSGPSATGGHHHQSAEAANRIEKPAPGNIIDTPTLEGVRGSILRLVEEREQFKRENSTLRHYKAVCAKLQKENIMLVKELQLLKSGEGVRGVFDEEETPRRPSRQSRRHSRLDEMGEEEEEEGSEISTEGEEEKGGREARMRMVRSSPDGREGDSQSSILGLSS